MFRLSQRSLDRMSGVDQRLIEIAEYAIEITKVDFGIPKTGGLRTAATQRRLFEDGVSKADGVNHRSKHQDGIALDFYALDPETGKASWDKGLLAQVACAFLQSAIELGVRIETGGLWNSIEDWPHVNLIE